MENDKKEIQYIKSLKINNVWNDSDIVIEWNLNPDVNILAGDNGSGKSTVLRIVAHALEKYNPEPAFFLRHQNSYGDINFNNNTGISFRFENHNSSAMDSIGNTNWRIDYINTFDQNLISRDEKQKLDFEIISALDWELNKLQTRYLDYQLKVGKRAREVLSNVKKNKPELIKSIDEKMNLFLDMIDDLFKITGKKIDRDENVISFIKGDIKLSPYQLSSGEKQMLFILMRSLVQDNKPYTMILDEPEISLHTDWQEKLISNIRKLNDNVQIIIATHSPSIIMEGWVDYVCEVEDLIIKK